MGYIPSIAERVGVGVDQRLNPVLLVRLEDIVHKIVHTPYHAQHDEHARHNGHDSLPFLFAGQNKDGPDHTDGDHQGLLFKYQGEHKQCNGDEPDDNDRGVQSFAIKHDDKSPEDKGGSRIALYDNQ